MGLSACGGGSGGSLNPTASSVTGIYTGGTTLAYLYLLELIDPAYASGYPPAKFTLTLNSSIADTRRHLWAFLRNLV